VYGKHQWINPGCFAGACRPQQLNNAGAVVVPGKLGNAGRVPVVGPDFVNTDFSLIKQFALPRKDMGLNFRASSSTSSITHSTACPLQDYGAPGFGVVNSTVNNPRLIQLALKLSF